MSENARASFGLRLVALFIDGSALLLVERALVALLDNGIALVVALFVAFAYFTYFEGSSSGQTAGKRAMSIRVIDVSGASVRPGSAALRFVARFPSAFALFVGYLWAIWDPEKQTWHDKIAGTLVVPTDAYPVDAWPGTFGSR